MLFRDIKGQTRARVHVMGWVGCFLFLVGGEGERVRMPYLLCVFGPCCAVAGPLLLHQGDAVQGLCRGARVHRPYYRESTSRIEVLIVVLGARAHAV